MRIILVEFGYGCDIEAEAFLTKESCKEYFTGEEIEFLSETEFEALWINEFNLEIDRTFNLYKQYEVM